MMIRSIKGELREIVVIIQDYNLLQYHRVKIIPAVRGRIKPQKCTVHIGKLSISFLS